jgi:hypothetical protein
MSFRLTVWYSAEQLSKAAAMEIDSALCEDHIEVVPEHKAIDSFYLDLIERYPEIDSIPEDRIDDSDYCPWSEALTKTPRHVSMNCVFSQAQKVIRYVYKLTCKHGLVLFDPQSGAIYHRKVGGKKS